MTKDEVHRGGPSLESQWRVLYTAYGIHIIHFHEQLKAANTTAIRKRQILLFKVRHLLHVETLTPEHSVQLIVSLRATLDIIQ